MKSIFSTIKLGALLLVVSFVAVACIKDDKSQIVTFGSFFTITKTASQQYVLLEDGGITVYPTAESVNSITNNKGFGDNKRAQFYVTYDEMTDKTKDDAGNITIKNAKLVGGQYVETTKTLSTEEANKKNILSNDSIFPVQSFVKCWAANGYINTAITGQYSAKNGKAIRPSVNLLVSDKNIKENEITFTILYNRHSTKNENSAGTADFVNSFDVSNLQIPGNDSILITVDVMGANSIKAKVARKAFK